MVVEGTPVGNYRIFYDLISDHEFVYSVSAFFCTQGDDKVFALFYPLDPPLFSHAVQQDFQAARAKVADFLRFVKAEGAALSCKFVQQLKFF